MQVPTEEPEEPLGTVQIYEVAPGTGSIQYTTPLSPRQAPAGPLISPGGLVDEPVTPTTAVAVAEQPLASVTVTT